ncbi:MAG: hypothetical protein V2J24_23740 [Pseudomonadales bacterium]|jgi:hypothetical protein|nr:hypothetical protein [Pseudomonadales bacterium]
MGKIYQTEEDLKNERRILRQYLAARGATGLKVKHMTMDYEWDWCVIKPPREVVGVIEVKQRAKLYPTIMLSWSKWRRGVQYVQEGFPTVLAISGPDADPHIRAIRVPPEIRPSWLSVEWGGRADRDKEEPLAMIPLSRFAVICRDLRDEHVCV